MCFLSGSAVWRQEAAEGAVGTVGPVALLAVQRLFIQVSCLRVFILLLVTPQQGHDVEARALELPVGALSRDLTLRDTTSSNIPTSGTICGWVFVRPLGGAQCGQPPADAAADA